MEKVKTVSINRAYFTRRTLLRKNLHLVGYNAYHPDAEWSTYTAIWARGTGDVGPLKIYISITSFGTNKFNASTMSNILDAAKRTSILS